MGFLTEQEEIGGQKMNVNLKSFVETLQFLKLHSNKIDKMLMDISDYSNNQIIDFDMMNRGLRKTLLKKGDKKKNVEDYLGKIITSLKYRERSGYGTEPESEDYEFEVEEPSIVPKKVFRKELYELQVELLKLQEWLKQTNKTVIIDGVEVPVLPAKAEEIIINKVTGQTYATIEEFNADVANPSTPTKAEDLQRDLKITVASLQVFGKTK